MRIITWNLNSIRTRRARLLRLLERHRPDVLCLQELRAEREEFPWLEVKAAGYAAAVEAQPARNGVAVLARNPVEVRSCSLPVGDRDEARMLDVMLDVAAGPLRVLSVYVPNGKSPRHPDWRYKLDWLGALRERLSATARPEEPLAVCGDFNVAPLDRDSAVADPNGVLCHPSARKALADLIDWGLSDAYRRRYPVGGEPDKGIYTWWDYTRLSFARDVGARIDHILVTPPLADRITGVRVDRDERRQRKGEDIPSDHAPLIADFTDSRVARLESGHA